MIVLGLTGSIGMGKSTVAKMFADLGIAIWDADAAVRRLYAPGGKAVSVIKHTFPDAISTEQHVGEYVDRQKLAQIVLNDREKLMVLEALVHPMVGEDRKDFLMTAAANKEEAVLFDIPLLFENHYEDEFDATIVVSASAHTQRERVLARPGMSEEKFNAILAVQMPDEEKRDRADYLISTDQSLEETRADVLAVWRDIQQQLGDQ